MAINYLDCGETELLLNFLAKASDNLFKHFVIISNEKKRDLKATGRESSPQVNL